MQSPTLQRRMQLQFFCHESIFLYVKESETCSIACGKDLIATGMKPGPQMGAVLQELLEMVLDQPEMNEKEKLLAWWKEHGTCQKAEGTL